MQTQLSARDWGKGKGTGQDSRRRLWSWWISVNIIIRWPAPKYFGVFRAPPKVVAAMNTIQYCTQYVYILLLPYWTLTKAEIDSSDGHNKNKRRTLNAQNLTSSVRFWKSRSWACAQKKIKSKQDWAHPICICISDSSIEKHPIYA